MTIDAFSTSSNVVKRKLTPRQKSFEIKEKIKRRVEEVKLLRQINSHGLIPYFQPIVNGEGEVSKYEALVRSVNQKGELMMPDTILKLPLKELKDHFFVFYRKILYEAKQTGMSVCLNFPASYLEGEEFESFFSFIEALGVGEQIVIEILETDITLNSHVLRNLKRMRGKGIKIAIDDFLSENSNAERICLLKPDIVKFDGRVVQGIEQNQFMQNFLQPIIQGLNKCGIETVIEKVETRDQFEVLKTMGFDFYQGYLFGRPDKEFIQ